MLLLFPNDGRKLRKLILGLLKAKLATEIKRLNYVQSYTLVNEHIEKKEEKLIVIQTEHKEKVLAFLQKSFPEAHPFSFPSPL
jgi:uncharacterized protein involved in tolerance to divalent cations